MPEIIKRLKIVHKKSPFYPLLVRVEIFANLTPEQQTLQFWGRTTFSCDILATTKSMCTSQF